MIGKQFYNLPIPPPSIHASQIFKDLTSPEFAAHFGDVTLVFEDGKSVQYYKSVLSLINVEWRTLLKSCSVTDLVILTGFSQKEFFKEVLEEIQIFERPIEKELFEEYTRGESELKAVDLCINVVAPMTEGFDCMGERVATSSSFLLPQEQPAQGPSPVPPEAKKRSKAPCPHCQNVTKTARHLWEAHRIGKTTEVACPKCGLIVSRQETLDRGLHTCRSDFKFHCAQCDTKYLTEKKLANHKTSGRCNKLSVMCQNCKVKVPSHPQKYRMHVKNCNGFQVS